VTDGQITNRDLYEAQRATEKQLGDLAVSVATLVAEWRGVGERLDSGSVKMADFEARLRVLEKWRWQLVGALLLLNGLAVCAGYLAGRK
jgi:hypothetical protein